MRNRILSVAGVAFTACLTLSESATAQRSEPTSITRVKPWNDLTCAVRGEFYRYKADVPETINPWDRREYDGYRYWIDFRNSGSQAATFSTEVFLGLDARTATTKLHLFNTTLGAGESGQTTLGAGESGQMGPYHVSLFFNGTHRYKLLAKADAANSSSESDERNNNCSLEFTYPRP